jgi:hypothetical protein
LSEWSKKLEAFEEEKEFIEEEVSSDDYLLKLSLQYGKLPNTASKLNQAIANTFHETGLGPNNWQLATAEYIVANSSSHSHRKQIWTVASGMGKSRIAATIALILLLKHNVQKVYMVFDQAELLQRDR